MKFSDFKYIFLILIIFSCQKDIPYVEPFVYNPSYVFLENPKGFPQPNIPFDNLTTEEGIQLGKKLFYDKILSGILCHELIVIFKQVHSQITHNSTVV